MAAFGGFVLALVFLDELLAMAAFGAWGWGWGWGLGLGRSPAWLFAWLLPLTGMLLTGLSVCPNVSRAHGS